LCHRTVLLHTPPEHFGFWILDFGFWIKQQPRWQSRDCGLRIADFGLNGNRGGRAGILDFRLAQAVKSKIA
jgi:hypothetical protein